MSDTISKAQAQAIAQEIDAAVREILTRHGLAKSKTRTTYGDAFSYKVEASGVELNDAGVNLATIEAQTHITYGNAYGFPSSPEERKALLGVSISYRGEQLTYVGISSSARKFPLMFCDKAGKRYGLPETVAARVVAAAQMVSA